MHHRRQGNTNFGTVAGVFSSPVCAFWGTKVQLLDLPGIIEGAAYGKGRGRQVVACAKTADLILMVLDDVGWADVGYHTSDFSTPHIDRLATVEGVRLERLYVQQVCSPTRSALMTVS